VERPQRASARTNDIDAREGPAHTGLTPGKGLRLAEGVGQPGGLALGGGGPGPACRPRIGQDSVAA